MKPFNVVVIESGVKGEATNKIDGLYVVEHDDGTPTACYSPEELVCCRTRSSQQLRDINAYIQEAIARTGVRNLAALLVVLEDDLKAESAREWTRMQTNLAQIANLQKATWHGKTVARTKLPEPRKNKGAAGRKKSEQTLMIEKLTAHVSASDL